ncbi:PREDICTED: coiled-coil domain-containing protein 42A [Pseudopodoces humilis]|uniref:coiled-coil domain-containing protein 42A n=1 Tax=Pseudopodoces humilis TaxID=181119 RepID=UPI0006B6BDA7|nr:PREDICTED: coiled-coil domain-containing protein 42A [Pseudopodoces humilis]
MEHEDISYYQGQYKDRLLPLLRELRAKEEDSTNSFICVLKKMKEVRLMEKVVEETEEAFTERMEALAEQWRDLHARRAQLKAHVVTSGTTVKENERLRTQALKKAKEEKEENSKKESELLRAREKLEALRKQHQKFSKKLLKYSLFKRYLENVVKNSQFRDIEDIISYYKALLRTRKDLLQSQWWYRQLMEQGKVLQQQIRAKKEAEMLQCKNDLGQLKESLEQAQSDIRQWEDHWAEVQERAAGKATELKSLTMAIHSLFQAASARLQPKGRVAAGDSHRQLDMVKPENGSPKARGSPQIQQFIYDLQDFTEDMKEHSRPL